jgi:hypothetical protein
MLCAAAAPVKYEGEPAQHQREPEPGQPDLEQLRLPVLRWRDADAVPAREVDLRQQEGHRHGEEGRGGDEAWGTRWGRG